MKQIFFVLFTFSENESKSPFPLFQGFHSSFHRSFDAIRRLPRQKRTLRPVPCRLLLAQSYPLQDRKDSTALLFLWPCYQLLVKFKMPLDQLAVAVIFPLAKPYYCYKNGFFTEQNKKLFNYCPY